MENLQSRFYFKVADSNFELEKSYRLRYNVYCQEKKWLAEYDCPDGLEKDTYDEYAVNVIALDEDFEVVGLMRILQQKNYGTLPFEKHPSLQGNKVMATSVAELSRFIVRSEKYSMNITKGLLRQVYRTSLDLGLENWTIVIEPSLIRLLKIFGWYFDPVSQPTKYFGAFTQVALGNIKHSESMWPETKPELETYYKANMNDPIAAIAS